MQPIKLPAELITDATACLRHDRSDSGSFERRILPRFRVWAAMPVLLLDGDPQPPRQATIWVRDMSRGGIGFLVPTSLKLPTEFIAIIPQTVAEPIRVLCTVVYRQEPIPSLLNIGSAFVRVLT